MGFAREPKLEGEPLRLEYGEPDGRVDVFLEDELGLLGGDLLDLDPAFGRGHDHGGFARPVDDDPDVELAPDVQGLFDEELADGLPFGAGLVRDQRHPEHPAGELCGLLGVRRDLDPAAFAPAAGMDLGFDDDPGPDPSRRSPGPRSAVSATSPLGTGTP